MEEQDSLAEVFISALREAVHKAGSQTDLAHVAGMQQSRISDYLAMRYDFNNITIGTLRKIFPELKIVYFAEKKIPDNVESELEKKILEHFRSLSAADKARYVMIMSANFSGPLLEKTK